MQAYRLYVPGLAILVLLAGCNGSSNKSNGSGTPSHLVYPQSSFLATRTEPITPDTPTVSGTVTGYSISPALPGGLKLDSATGTISGTPTAVSPLIDYTVTASNSSGSTTATVQIRVEDAAPQNLTYANSTIGAVVGTAITPDTPSNQGGIITSYAVSPALPGGLNVDPTTGVISGTPTAPSPTTQYTVTGANATDSITAIVTISVGQPASVLLDLGHYGEIQALQTNGSQVISEDMFGHWVLWDYASGNMIQSGDGAETADAHGVAVAGSVAVVNTSGGILVYSAATGTQTATIPASPWFRLASDGSYIATGSSTALTVWTAQGQTEFTHNGDYHAASVFAAPGQVQVAMGAAGANVIETFSVPSGNSTVSPSFMGTFYGWFTDGQKFLSSTGNTVWVYSSAAAQLGISSLPTITGLGGEGNWIWVMDPGSSNNTLQIYTVGGNTPVQSYTFGSDYFAIGSGNTIAAAGEYETAMSVVDLSGSAPVKTDYTITPLSGTVAYAATSSAQWLVGSHEGVILDGASLATKERFLDYGPATSIAGNGNLVAIGTMSSQVVLFDVSKSEKLGTVDFDDADRLTFSTDGTILGAGPGIVGNTGGISGTDTTVNFYSVPTLALLDGIPSQYNQNGTPYLSEFTLSGSGTGVVVGQLLETNTSSGGGGFQSELSDLAGKEEATLETNMAVPLLSPDGTLAAVPTQDAATTTSQQPNQTTNIYKNGQLATAVNGLAVGWIDNNSLLAETFSFVSSGMGGSTQITDVIYSASGATVATLPVNSLPALAYPQFPTSTSVYDVKTNAIYSLKDGSVIWSSNAAAYAGAVCGPNVVYATGHQVLVTAYQ